MEPYEPKMSPERAERLRRWHLETSSALHGLADHTVDYLGLGLHVPAGVFPPAPMSQLLGRAVMESVVSGDQVLDMGTGSGVNAILAAREGADVLAVDINPSAVAAAVRNAEQNDVADRVRARVTDLFDGVDGRFDVIVFDPPFRWFTPVDMLDRAFTDEGYATLARFFEQAGDHLTATGQLLMFFGTTGDIEHFGDLATSNGFSIEGIDSAELTKDTVTETYWAYRLRPSTVPALLVGHRPGASEPVPLLVEEAASGEPIEAVWRNQSGGLTFRVGEGDDCRFVKWMPASAMADPESEAARLRWASAFVPVPAVLDVRTDPGGSLIVTTPVPGRSAVDDRWLAAPGVAVRAIGAGLRELHNRLPVSECPFTWSLDERIDIARQRLTAPAFDPSTLQPEHRGLTPSDALDLLMAPPTIDRLVVCHGDACAPNTIVGDDGRWSGHVDLGDLGVADRWADLAVAEWSTRWNYGPGWEPALYAAYGVDEDIERVAYYRLLWDVSS